MEESEEGRKYIAYNSRLDVVMITSLLLCLALITCGHVTEVLVLCFSGIAVCIGMASTFAFANSTLKHQVSLRVRVRSLDTLSSSVTND